MWREKFALPGLPRRLDVRLDPDFDYLTYGDNGTRRGAGLHCLSQMTCWFSTQVYVPSLFKKSLVYALVGLFVVEEVVRAVDIPVARRRQNAHTRWTTISQNDVIVRGKRGVSGRFGRCITVGEFRDKAYRVRGDIEEAWGGLTVKNGYIQRSAVPPAFVNARKFYTSFRQAAHSSPREEQLRCQKIASLSCICVDRARK